VALNLDDKKAIVAEVNETAAQALSLVIADARGVDVTDMNALRAKARAENVQLRVIRNTLAKRAFAETDYACVEEVLAGPSLFAFSMEDPGAAARLFKDFAKENEEFEVKALSVSGQLLGKEQLGRSCLTCRPFIRLSVCWLASHWLRLLSWYVLLMRIQLRQPAQWLQFVMQNRKPHKRLHGKTDKLRRPKMALSNEDILNAIAEMSVMDVVELG
jgi:large subunit ribosomal protein L10